jgi:hypothetical protein
MEQPKHLFRIALFALSKNEGEVLEKGRKVKRRTMKYETGIASNHDMALDLARDFWKLYPDAVWNKEVRIVDDAGFLIYQYPHVQPLPQTRKDTPQSPKAPKAYPPKTKSPKDKAPNQKTSKAGKGV